MSELLAFLVILSFGRFMYRKVKKWDDENDPDPPIGAWA